MTSFHAQSNGEFKTGNHDQYNTISSNLVPGPSGLDQKAHPEDIYLIKKMILDPPNIKPTHLYNDSISFGQVNQILRQPITKIA